MSVARAARRRDGRPPARAVAALLLAALSFGLLAPAAVLVDDTDADADRCCGPGRCCCAGTPTDATCVRAACHCDAGPRSPGLVAAAADEAVLPRSAFAPPGCTEAELLLDGRPSTSVGVAAVPEPPPWLALSGLVFA